MKMEKRGRTPEFLNFGIQVCAPIALIVMICAGASAQWIDYKWAGIPRTPDGKPNMGAPAPRARDGKPDLSGLWHNLDVKYLNDLSSDGVQIPFTPQGEAIYKQRLSANAKGRPSESCLPHGIPDSMTVPAAPWRVVQNPGVTMILYEFQNRYRQIFTDGRGFPEDMNPAWLGYSIGKWDGDTFVVETRGFNDRSWLDDNGHPHSDQLKVTERFHRRDFGHLDLQITIDDPRMYTQPWTVNLPFELYPDNELMEWVCENERDSGRSTAR